MNTDIFSIPEATNISLVGGKAFALSKMIQGGFNVPNGFVLSANTFNNMTPQLSEAVLAAFDNLGADFVAVRSSAIGEDSQDAAWAGQLDTFLNCTRKNLIENINACWKSAYSERATSYAQQKGIESTKVAVIIQEMIPSEVSGVAFSTHPVTQDSAQVVIEAGLGLGEAIVSGEITPDTYIVNKETGRAIEKHISAQKKKLVRGPTGETAWEDIDNNLPKLTDQHITELTMLATKIEVFFQSPVDVEWAIYNNVMYVLQSRPITTLAAQ